jgi:hypothetical protein
MAYFDKTDGSAFRLAALCLGHQDPPQSALIGHAAVACGITRLICTTPVFLARGRTPFPGIQADHRDGLQSALQPWRVMARERLAAARSIWRRSTRAERSACLSLALVEPYLTAAVQHDRDMATMLTDIDPLSRIWRLWQAHAIGRI